MSDAGSGLADHQRSALELTEAFLIDPADLTPTARADLLRHFQPSQIVELVFKLMTYTVNKSIAALGFDRAISEGRLALFHYDGAGAQIIEVPDDPPPSVAAS
jgi:hypothetical protein